MMCVGSAHLISLLFGSLDATVSNVGHEDSIFDALGVTAQRCHGRWCSPIHDVIVCMEVFEFAVWRAAKRRKPENIPLIPSCHTRVLRRPQIGLTRAGV